MAPWACGLRAESGGQPHQARGFKMYNLEFRGSKYFTALYFSYKFFKGVSTTLFILVVWGGAPSNIGAFY